MKLTPAERQKRYRQRYPEKVAAAMAKYREKNIEKVREAAKLRARKRRAENPDACREYQREYMRKNPHVARRCQVKLKYKLTMEQVEALFDAQGRCCAICKTTDQGPVKSWPIDHDHRTGKVRGILCAWCNLALRKNRDTVEYLQSAIAYLQRPPFEAL